MVAERDVVGGDVRAHGRCDADAAAYGGDEL